MDDPKNTLLSSGSYETDSKSLRFLQTTLRSVHSILEKLFHR